MITWEIVMMQTLKPVLTRLAKIKNKFKQKIIPIKPDINLQTYLSAHFSLSSWQTNQPICSKASLISKTIPFKRLSLALLLPTLLYLPSEVQADPAPDLKFISQGDKWTDKERLAYYTQDQGSELMPLKWFISLTEANGELFLRDNLNRYGYLANPTSPTKGLPVGFTTTTDAKFVGLTCSACHVREIKVDNSLYRIDGGPAIVDFQSFATDLGATVKATLTDEKLFADFAEKVLGKSPTAAQKNDLHQQLQTWLLPYATIMDNALPKDKPWGPARVDAVGMIFNRISGLDIANTPDHINVKNIYRADAPVRYPFLWNTSIQDKTQWPGFADNGNTILAVSRNLGEVLGVFAHFNPQKSDWRVLGIDYLKNNSANFKGLKVQEEHLKNLGPPKWPWTQGSSYAINPSLATRGKAIFESTTQTEAGGCVTCHGIRKGALRGPQATWATPLCDVNTDQRQFNLLSWTVDTGVLAGAQIPFLQKPLAQTDLAFNVLGVSVIGAILQHETHLVVDIESDAQKEFSKFEAFLGAEKSTKIQDKIAELHKFQEKLITDETSYLQGAFQTIDKTFKKPISETPNCKDDFKTATPAKAFESRVLQGIWATAPYLHNGSIPTLADLLKPVAERAAAFKVGQAYDPVKVGLAETQTQFNFTYQTTDCADSASGNSRCGHEFGTHLNPEDKAALLEYLKQL
jgi:hypothetical protein